MKLLKVSVPNFRNLQNVELTFEPDLSPAVFPIASQNGGGKSTLLQLIFALFHCGVDYRRYQYLNNIFSNNKKLQKGEIYNVANFDFSYQGKIVSLSFNFINFDLSAKKSTYIDLFEVLDEENNLIKEINKRQSVVDDIRDKKQKEIHKRQVEQAEQVLKKFYHEQAKSKGNKKHNFLYSLIIDFNFNGIKMSNSQQVLYCSIENNIEYDFAREAFTSISNQIFIAAPSTQPFIFLDQATRKILLHNLGEYCNRLVAQKDNLPNLYLYSQLTIAKLLETFTSAREQDWQEALISDDLTYGSNLKKIRADFHNFLGHDKYILPTPQLDSIVVQKQISATERIKLEPEDLSHGELRRLGLYAWIKYNIPENSIILIDEIENALHPDWQYNIADELASWGNNQYLLATHSFHLCEALTPKHVKEIEPKMCRQNSQ